MTGGVVVATFTANCQCFAHLGSGRPGLELNDDPGWNASRSRPGLSGVCGLAVAINSSDAVRRAINSSDAVRRRSGLVCAGIRDTELLRAAGEELGVKFYLVLRGVLDKAARSRLGGVHGDGRIIVGCDIGAESHGLEGESVAAVLEQLVPAMRIRLGKVKGGVA